MTPQKLKAIDVGEVQPGKWFTAEYDITIPEYQRPYTWGKDDALQLLDDLQGIAGPRHRVAALPWLRRSSQGDRGGPAAYAELTKKLMDEWEQN